MKRAAIFVEGQTEAVFVRALLQEMAGARGVSFLGEKQFGGVFQQEYRSENTGAEFEVLIANCCNDGKVVSSIRERYISLVAAGYQLILGLRDLFPFTPGDLARLQTGMASVMPTGGIPAHVVVAVAEVEAWFIEEVTHFARVHIDLTEEAIEHATGYKLSDRVAETLPHPADTLDKAYQIVGFSWKKRLNQVERTVQSLDYDFLLGDVPNHSASFTEFIAHVDGFLN